MRMPWKTGASTIALALAAIALSACGSDGGSTTTQPPAISSAEANRLATLSERIATDLDDGNTCDAAHAADELSAAVEDARMSEALRPDVEEVATRLVDEVNCPPPPPPPEPEKKPKKKKKPEDHGNQGDGGKQGPPGHSGGLPPGQAKLKGEDG
jgi:hypothetical protein